MMTGIALSNRDRRTLAAGAGVVGALFLFARGVPAWRAWHHGRVDAAERVSVDVGRLRDGLRALPLLRDSLRARHARLALLDSSLLRGVSPPIAAAALASAVTDLANDNSIKTISLQMRSDSAAILGLARIQVRLNGVTDVAGLAGFLRAVEGGVRPLVVRELSVTQPEPAASDAKPETLRIDVLVESIASIGPASSLTSNAVESATGPNDSLLAEAEDAIVSNDPFRLANEPAKVRFDPANENGLVVAAAPAPRVRPVMSLKGIVGPPWQAIVDGIPGQPPGTVVRSGARFDQLSARAVTRDSVIMQGPDTTWVLTFRRMQ